MVRTTYGEVRNQGDDEIRAVCQVIYNRWKLGYWGDSIKEVVLHDRQFSVWNYNDNQRPILLGDLVSYSPQYPRVHRICGEVVKERLTGRDTSMGLTHFYHPNSMEPRCVKYKTKYSKRYRKRIRLCVKHRRLPPRWASSYQLKVRIGAGVFFKKSM